MQPWGFNHMAVPTMSVAVVFGLAAKLGCVGVECRNDLVRPLCNDMTATHQKRDAALAGVKALQNDQAIQTITDPSKTMAGSIAFITSQMTAAAA